MSALSAFLQNHFLLAPALLWFAVMAPLIILLYFLKLKREEFVVSSILLWHQSIQDLRVNAPFQRLRRNLLLFLQLLFLLLIVLAMARPLLNLKQVEGRARVVLVDVSASMGCRDADGTRLDAAKRQVLELIRNMVEGDRLALIRFSDQAAVVSSFTGDKARLMSAVSGLEVETSETSLREALTIGLSLAQAQTSAQKRAEIHLFSDGRFRDTADFAAQTGEVIYHPLGGSGRNVGLTAVDVAYPAGEGAEPQIFYGIENFDVAEANVTLEFLLNGELIGARSVQVGPGLRSSGLAPAVGQREGLLELKLTTGDLFPLDDVGHAVIRRPPQARVLMVGPGDFFLTQALGVARAKISRIAPEAYAADMAPNYDVVVFDGWAPRQAGRGSFLFHDCHPVVDGLQVGELVETPVLLDWDRTHPLMRFFSLGEVFVLRMKRVTPPKWMRVLAQTSEGPLILCSEQEGFRALYLPFHMSTASNFSAQGTFPIFVLNALRWLPETFSIGSPQLTAGQILVVPAGKATTATVTDPAGGARTVQASEGRFIYPHTRASGIYKVEIPDAPARLYAVNLLSSTESNVNPASQFSLKGAEVKAEAQVTRANREVWHWLALAAFVLLLFEWYIYNARVYL